MNYKNLARTLSHVGLLRQMFFVLPIDKSQYLHFNVWLNLQPHYPSRCSVKRIHFGNNDQYDELLASTTMTSEWNPPESRDEFKTLQEAPCGARQSFPTSQPCRNIVILLGFPPIARDDKFLQYLPPGIFKRCSNWIICVSWVVFSPFRPSWTMSHHRMMDIYANKMINPSTIL